MQLTHSDREKIARQYDKSLLIPSHNLTHRFILAPVGLVGSGKSTVVKPLSEKFSLVRISSDEIREILKKLSCDYTQEDVLYIDILLLRKYLKSGYGVVFDSDCENKVSIIKELEKEFDVPVIWININPPEEFILNKLQHMSYEKGHVFKNAQQAIATYFKDKPIHRNLSMPFISTIDTSKENLNGQIYETSEKISKSLI